jgi:LysM repeat protein
MGNILKGLKELLSQGNLISDVISDTDNLVSEGVADSYNLDNLSSDDSEIDKNGDEPVYYVAQKGDTIYKICNDNGITAANFRKWNKINNDIIKIGTKYIIEYKKSSKAPQKIRQVIVTITKNQVGITIINSYSDTSLRFKAPLYEVKVESKNESGELLSKSFKAVRFGIAYKYKGGYDKPGWTGYTSAKRFVVQNWLPKYLEDSAKDLPVGAFVVNGTFYIHTGARDTAKYTVGSVGCVEIEGNGAWEDFVKTVKSFANAPSEVALTKSGKMIAIYEAEPYPKMIEIK